MQVSDLPTRTPTVFASGAGSDYIRNIPIPSQIGIHDGEASYTDGFPPLCFVEEGAGGYPPDGRDVNGILNNLSGWARWQQAGGPVTWNSSFASSIGGYPSGAIVESSTTPGVLYVNTVDNNTANPVSGGSNWVTLASVILTNAALTGTPTAPSAALNSSNTQVANTFYADRSASNAQAAAQAYAAANFVDNQGGTVFTPGARQFTIGDGFGGAVATLNGAAGTNRIIHFQTAGLARFDLFVSSGAETGANAGSNLFLQADDDTGASLGTVFSVTRATRILNFAVSPTVPNLAQNDGSTKAINSNYADNVGFGPNTAIHNVAGSRVIGGVYSAPATKGMWVSVFGKTNPGSATTVNLNLNVTGLAAPFDSVGVPQIGVVVGVRGFVPAGSTYSVGFSSGSATFTVAGWTETY
jgi:hypothetical protein